MAKKRKLRSSLPEPVPEPAKTLEQEQDLIDHQPEPDQALDQQQNMAVDEPAPPQDEPQNDVEEEEQQQQPEGEVGAEGEEEEEEEQQEQQQQGEGETLENQEAQLTEQNQQGSVEPSTQANGAEQEEEEDLGLEDEPVEKLLEPFTREQMHSLVMQAVEKYPEFAANIRQLAEVDPAHRKIFVHGLGWDATAETLTSVFGKYGEIEDCKAVTDKLSGKSKGYAFILFKTRAGARRALKQPQKRIGNRTTSCQLASAGPVPAPPPTAPPVVSEYTQRKIFVSNVSSEIDPMRLLEFFKQFGEVEDGPLGIDKQTGKPKGFALFVYKSVESAKKALEEPHKNFEGHTLYCQKAVDGPKGSKGFHHQQHYQHQQHHSHHRGHQGHFHQRKDKNAYSSGGQPHGGAGGGHLMAPSSATPPSVGGYVPPAPQGLNPALGHALTALFANQPGLGLGNLLGGMAGAPVNQPGPPAGAYGNQPAMNYGNQPGMQPGYQNPQMGQSSGVRPHPGAGAGAPYMGH